MISAQDLSTQQKLEALSDSLFFETKTVWIKNSMDEFLSELKDYRYPYPRKEAREEARKRLIDVFWHRYMTTNADNLKYWGHLIDGAFWEKPDQTDSWKGGYTKLKPIIGREDISGWLDVIRSGVRYRGKIESQFTSVTKKRRLSHMLVQEGLIRYLRRAAEIPEQAEEFCACFLEGFLLEEKILGNRYVPLVLEDWGTAFGKAWLAEYSDTSYITKGEEIRHYMMERFASAWLLFLDRAAKEMEAAGKPEKGEHFRLIAECFDHMAGRHKNIHDYAMHLTQLFESSGFIRQMEVFGHGVKSSYWPDTGDRSGQDFLYCLYRSVSQIFRADAKEVGAGRIAADICTYLDKASVRGEGGNTHGELLIKTLALLTASGRGPAGGVGFYSAFEDYARDWAGDLRKYNKYGKETSALQESVVGKIYSAWTEGGPLYPYEQTWSHIRRNGLEHMAGEQGFPVVF